MKIKYIIALLVSAILFTQCGSQKGPVVRTARYRAGGGSYSSQQNSFNPENKHIVLYNAQLTITSKESSDSVNAYLANFATSHGGFVVKLGYNQSIIRVLSVNLGKALNELSGSHTVSKKVITGEDVTSDYMDYQLRLDNAIKARERYLELLKQSENVSTTLQVEKELERITGEIEELKGELNKLGVLAEYATITIDLEKQSKPGVIGYVFVGIYKGVKWLFVRE